MSLLLSNSLPQKRSRLPSRVSRRLQEMLILGGGHNPSGASSTDGGMVIDLSRYLNQVTVDPKSKFANVGGGALWSDVDKATCPLGLATVGGTVTAVSHLCGYALTVDRRGRVCTPFSADLTNRLTLGGGYGFLTGRHGLTIDNLVGATVVIANGQVLNVDKYENQDVSIDRAEIPLTHQLFWAIRGGGSNFGIVTNFRFALHPIPAICWLGVLHFSPDQLEKVVEASLAWKQKMSVDDSVLMGIQHTTTDLLYVLPFSRLTIQVILVACVHIGPEDAAKKQFKPFYKVGKSHIARP